MIKEPFTVRIINAKTNEEVAAEDFKSSGIPAAKHHSRAFCEMYGDHLDDWIIHYVELVNEDGLKLFTINEDRAKECAEMDPIELAHQYKIAKEGSY